LQGELDERTAGHAQLEPLLLKERTPGGVVTLTLNRPGAVQLAVGGDAGGAAGGVRPRGADAGARVVVIAGAGKAFCAGHDLKQMKSNPRQDYYEKLFADCAQLMLTDPARAAAGDRPRARHRHGGRLPAGGDVRPGRGCRRHAVRLSTASTSACSAPRRAWR
jgi:hypothetical protein